VEPGPARAGDGIRRRGEKLIADRRQGWDIVAAEPGEPRAQLTDLMEAIRRLLARGVKPALRGSAAARSRSARKTAAARKKKTRRHP
jgi:hypothetical protein